MKKQQSATSQTKADGNQKRSLSAREVALDVLTRVEQDQSYSNLLLNQSLQKHALIRQDSALATEIVYGTIQRLNTIDYFLARFVQKGMAKLEPWVRTLLRLSFYQLYYLDRIPAHAAVNEAVNIAKRKGHQGISGMVNGVLRSVIRSKDELVVPDTLSSVERISLAHSHPDWMVRRWIKQYGAQTTERICAANNLAPHVSIRVNTLNHDRENMLQMLKNEGLEASVSTLSPSGIVVHNGGNMAHTPWFTNGDVSIQDESSMLVAEVVDPQPGMTVLDCCAAPGGKTTHMAEKMKNIGRIYAADLHPHKQDLIREQAARLQLTSIETLVEDARHLRDRFAEASFDRILLDAPCSGLGVIRRKPDIKWSKQAGEIAEIMLLQQEILSNIKHLLRPGGILVYSTCTMEYEENQGMILRFLQENPDFEPVEFPEHVQHLRSQQGMVQLLPHDYHSDGFFIARLRRKP